MSKTHITKFELARVVGTRATQIENGAEVHIKVKEGMHDSLKIAMEELKAGKCPITIIRIMPNGSKKEIKCDNVSFEEHFGI